MNRLKQEVEKYAGKGSNIVKQAISTVPTPNRLQMVLLTVMAVPALFFRRFFIAFLLMTAVTSVSIMTNKFEIGSFGIELATFSSVTMAYIFSPKIAALLGFIYIILQIFTGSTPGMYIVWVIPTYTIASFLVAALEAPDIAQTGVYVTLACQVFFALMTFITSRDRLAGYIQYATFNLVFNILLFQSLGQTLIDLAA